MAIYFFISVFVAIVVALITLNWFFRDGEESTRSMQEYCEDRWRPWWASKFGLWLGVSSGAGIVCYVGLPQLWAWVRTFF